MAFVDQHCVSGSRFCLGDPFPGIFDATGILGYGEDFEILVFQLLVKRLPAWQVKAAASPGSPRNQEDFFAAKVREGVCFARHIGQCEIGSPQRSQGLPLVSASAEIPG